MEDTELQDETPREHQARKFQEWLMWIAAGEPMQEWPGTVPHV